jgi:MFS superfamily sulfate permease-like transporter
MNSTTEDEFRSQTKADAFPKINATPSHALKESDLDRTREDQPSTSIKPSTNTSFQVSAIPPEVPDPENWRTIPKERILQNFLSALSISLVSFPFALSIVLSINERLQEPAITYSSSVQTTILGFLSVLIYSAGRILFRTFTGLLYPIFVTAAEEFGKEGIAAVSLVALCMLCLGVILNLFRYIRYIPGFLFDGIKLGTGAMLIMGEIYSLTGTKDKTTAVTLSNFLADVVTKSSMIRFNELIIGVCVGIGLYFINNRWKKIPSIFILFVIGIAYGYFGKGESGTSGLILLRELSPGEFKNHSFFSWDGNHLADALHGLRHPMVYFYGAGIVLMILFEMCISIGLNEDAFDQKVKRKREFFSLSITNGIGFIFGLLPLSVPVGRVQFALKLGADHRLFNLFCVLILLFLYIFCFDIIGYIPISFMKGLNILISLILMEFNVLSCYHRYSKIICFAMLWVVICMLTMNLLLSLAGCVIGYFIIYHLRVKNLPNDQKLAADGTLEVTLRGRYASEKIAPLIHYCRQNRIFKLKLDFSEVITSEVNYLRNYRESIQALQKTVKKLQIVGLGYPAGGGLDKKNVLLYKVPVFRLYLS